MSTDAEDASTGAAAEGDGSVTDGSVDHGPHADGRNTDDSRPDGSGLAGPLGTSTRKPKPDRPWSVSVLVAGGGTAGHIEPALNTADALRALDPLVRVVALGTARGLETTLVPARGYQLELVTPVPLPRKPSADLLKLTGRLRTSIKETRAVMKKHHIDVVVGFGGYVALPAYLAARKRVPIIVHEANARAGLANKIGARFATRVVAAVPDSGLPHADVIGIPVRAAIAKLDRAALRDEARSFFGLDPEAPTILVFGGSQGAGRINEAVSGAARALAAAGIGVLHAYGKKNTVTVDRADTGPAYVDLPYIDRMDLAYAAADLVVARSGAMTVAELATVGLPAVYVPLPHGNGEQRLNASVQLASGAAIAIDDAALTSDIVVDKVLPLLTDPATRSAMATAAARRTGGDAADDLARLVYRYGAEHLAGHKDRHK